MGDQKRPHILLQLTSGSPAALPIPLADRGEQRPTPWPLAIMKNGEGLRDREQSQRTPGEQAKAAAVNDSSNSRYRSRQSGVGGVASGQKTATGPTETTRANTGKTLAVHKPPTLAQRPHKGK